jgi:hypothetical protein
VGESAVGGVDATVHISPDALADRLMCTTWNGSVGTPQLVDDGQRP